MLPNVPTLAEQGFAEADRVYEATYISPPASHVPMEPFVVNLADAGAALERRHLPDLQIHRA